MRFEFDPEKSEQNKLKHGLDFIDAQALWLDADRLEVPARTRGEPRFATLGRLDADVWVAIWTPHGSHVRLISVRRARENERKLYEG